MSHEAIYQWVYAKPVSTLARELIRLRTGADCAQGWAVPATGSAIEEPVLHRRSARRGGGPGNMPRVGEGDLIIGKDGKTAVATLVERMSRFLILVR